MLSMFYPNLIYSKLSEWTDLEIHTIIKVKVIALSHRLQTKQITLEWLLRRASLIVTTRITIQILRLLTDTDRQQENVNTNQR